MKMLSNQVIFLMEEKYLKRKEKRDLFDLMFTKLERSNLSKNSKIYIAGHNGMVGSSCYELLDSKGFKNIIKVSSKKLDLRNTKDVSSFFKTKKPEIVINAAAKVGGIMANNKNLYEFLLENMQIQNNLINESLKSNVNTFIFGSSCIYPKMSSQPIKEEYLLDGPLEKTNEGYALAKITGVKLCEYIRNKYNKYFISLMPTSAPYGPFDNFDLETSHVLPAMIRKFHNSKLNNEKIRLWEQEPLLENFYM